MSAGHPWRLLDTGALNAARNIALDQVMLELRDQETIPDTIRFLQFSRPAVLIGRHQVVSQEARLDYCRQKGIEINRRITGGGAIYMDSSQIGWEVIATRSGLLSRMGAGIRMEDLTELVCRAVVSGLHGLGIEAGFRPRNDIEVKGRKLSGTGGAYEGDAFLFQGTLLIRNDLESMFRALRVPTEKLASHEIATAAERVVDLSSLLSGAPAPAAMKAALARGFVDVFGIRLEPGRLSNAEVAKLETYLPHFCSDGWVNEIDEPPGGNYILSSVYKGEGGLVRAVTGVDLKRRRIKNILFTGDFFIAPARTVFDLEACLKDARFDSAASRIHDFFSRERPETLSLEPADFWLALKGCLDKCSYAQLGIPIEQVEMVSLVGGSSLEEIAATATALLLPYCAKDLDCHLRHHDGCDQCGECDIGEAYRLAEKYGVKPLTIHNYEHLKDTFNSLRASGTTAFIGCCCRAFLAKRYRAFSSSGLLAAIIDIGDNTCYDLKQEEAAYRGHFENQTSLRLDLLQKVFEIGAAEKPRPVERSRV